MVNQDRKQVKKFNKDNKDDEIRELIDFAIIYHPAFAQISKISARAVFDMYKKTTLIYRTNGQIKGFVIYQEWPKFLNFLAIAGENGLFQVMWWILHNKKLLPDKPFGYFDELRMKGRFLCQSCQY